MAVSAILAISLFVIVVGSMVAPAAANSGLVCDTSRARPGQVFNCELTAQNIQLTGLQWWANGRLGFQCNGLKTCAVTMPSVSVLIVEVCTAGQTQPCMRGTSICTACDQAVISLEQGTVLGGTAIPTDKFGLIATYIALASAALAGIGAVAYYSRARHKKR